jgi:hypothetical protein
MALLRECILIHQDEEGPGSRTMMSIFQEVA